MYSVTTNDLIDADPGKGNLKIKKFVFGFYSIKNQKLNIFQKQFRELALLGFGNKMRACTEISFWQMRWCFNLSLIQSFKFVGKVYEPLEAQVCVTWKKCAKLQQSYVVAKCHPAKTVGNFRFYQDPRVDLRAFFAKNGRQNKECLKWASGQVRCRIRQHAFFLRTSKISLRFRCF